MGIYFSSYICSITLGKWYKRSRSFEHKIELKRRERIIRNPLSDLRNYSVTPPLTNENNFRAQKRNSFPLFQTSDDRPMLITNGEALEERIMP